MGDRPAGVVRHPFPVAELPARAAHHIIADRRAELPDLTRCVILVPDLHAAAAIAQALYAAAQMPVVLLPRITTLVAWAAQIPIEAQAVAPAAREAMLYAALDRRHWFAHGDRWAIAAELAALFDELTRWRVALPETLDDFTRRIESAYRARAGHALSFEARVVHELWRAFAGAGAADPEAVHALRLAALARQATLPLYAIGLERLAPGEREFFDRYAERAPVIAFEGDRAAGDPLAQTLHAAWPPAVELALPARAHALREIVPDSPLAGRLRIVGCAHAEAEAQAIDTAVREWLLAGRRSIAVVVQDRVVARRARALLERAQVLVKDEAGWAFSTTSAATVVGRLLDVVAGDGYHRDLLDLMKSPFAFDDLPPTARRAAVARFEQLVRRHGAVAGLGAFRELAVRAGDAEAQALMERVITAGRAFGRGRATLVRWLAALREALAALGAAAGFEADAAGSQLLELLDALERELAGDTLTMPFAEWRRWLARRLEDATFRDRAIDSPVVFTHLAATRLRRFDAVLVAGGDAAHLPGPDPAALFFNQGVRAELGLPTRADALREIEEQFAALIAMSGELTVTRQRTVDGEANLLSPLLQRLDTLHHLAWGRGLDDSALAARAPHAQVTPPSASVPPPAPSAQPAPRAPATLLPEKISASGYNALIACPYQYYARHLLGLDELDEVQEEIEKSDYGQRVHRALARFHRKYPRVAELAPEDALRALNEISEHEFRDAVVANYLDRAWLARWQALIPDYLDWQRAREAAGWRFITGEAEKEIAITTPAGHTLMLRGQLDRVDCNEEGAAAVIDYKTRRAPALKEALAAPGEDVQLPVYALLWGVPVAAALFLSIERDGVTEVPLKQDIAPLAQAARVRLAAMFDALHGGAPLPANGAEQVCTYCEMRGLCRLDYWK